MIIPQSISLFLLAQTHHTHLYNSLRHFLIDPYVFVSNFIEFTRAHIHTRKYSHLHTNSTLSCWILFHPTHAFTHFILLLKQPWINSRFLYYNDNMNITLCLLLFKTNSLPLCVIFGRVLKWYFLDGKNEKYCQLLFAVKMGASSHNNNKHTLHVQKEKREDLRTRFLKKYQEFGLLTSNALIIRFHIFFGH